MHHLDDLALAEGGQVGHERRWIALVGWGPHDHDNPFVGTDHVDELADAAGSARPAHEGQCFVAVVARTRGGLVAAMPLDVGVEQPADDVEVAAQRGFVAAAGQLDVGLGHNLILPARAIFRYIRIFCCILDPVAPETPTAPFVLPRQPAAPDLVAKYFRGLGDATRVRILELLEKRGELSVGELMTAVRQSQSKVSNHLACLRWCGFVEARRQGRIIRYRIADERVSQVLALGRELLSDNSEHVAACGRIGPGC